MIDKTTYTLVGAIVGGFGVRGEVRLKSFCAIPEDIARYSPLTGEAGESYTISKFRQIKDGFAATIKEIATKEDADALRGTKLFASRDRFPELEEDEFYHADLIGLAVFDGDGQAVGKISAIQNFGAGDILEVDMKTAKGQRRVMVPFTRTIVPNIDIATGRAIIDPPGGLLDDE